MGDVDRRKHDVDVIERVLGGVRETVGPTQNCTELMDVEVFGFGGSIRSTVELTVGLPDDHSAEGSDRSRRR